MPDAVPPHFTINAEVRQVFSLPLQFGHLQADQYGDGTIALTVATVGTLHTLLMGPPEFELLIAELTSLGDRFIPF